MRERPAGLGPGQDYVVVGRMGRPHGLRGELAVELRTDEPDRRFAAGAVLLVSGRGPAPDTVTVAATRWHQGRLLVRLREVTDRTAAEQARGWELCVPVDPGDRPEDDEEFYDHQLVGLDVVDTSGSFLGTVERVDHRGGQDVLVVDADGREVLVPFVRALVPEVDVPGGRLVVDDRPGLFGEWA